MRGRKVETYADRQARSDALRDDARGGLWRRLRALWRKDSAVSSSAIPRSWENHREVHPEVMRSVGRRQHNTSHFG